jgi:hypothetical protein
VISGTSQPDSLSYDKAGFVTRPPLARSLLDDLTDSPLECGCECPPANHFQLAAYEERLEIALIGNEYLDYCRALDTVEVNDEARYRFLILRSFPIE